MKRQAKRRDADEKKQTHQSGTVTVFSKAAAERARKTYARADAWKSAATRLFRIVLDCLGLLVGIALVLGSPWSPTWTGKLKMFLFGTAVTAASLVLLRRDSGSVLADPGMLLRRIGNWLPRRVPFLSREGK